MYPTRILLSLLVAVCCVLPGFGQYSHKELLEMEKKVQATVKRVTPATVSIIASQTNGAGSGSGTVVSKDGLILTAAHVLGNAKELVIIFPDGKRVKGEALGCNYERDIGMARITEEENREWSFVKLGESGNVKVTDIFIAMGHASGFDARRPPPPRVGRAYNRGTNRFIMTDCVLIGGDSGGPLFDLDGNLIGIHSFIGGSLSQNNHAPVDQAKADWDKLKAGEKWGHGFGSAWSDQFHRPDSPVMGFKLDPEADDVIVTAVYKDGPAAKAGLQAGDKLLKINGKETPDRTAFYDELQKLNPQDKIALELERDGKHLKRELILARRGDFYKDGEPDVLPVPDGPDQAGQDNPDNPEAAGKPWIGLTLTDSPNGIVISEIDPDGPAAKAGLENGDLLIRIDKTAPKDTRNAAVMVREMKPETEMTWIIKRDGKELSKKIIIGSQP